MEEGISSGVWSQAGRGGMDPRGSGPRDNRGAMGALGRNSDGLRHPLTNHKPRDFQSLPITSGDP